MRTEWDRWRTLPSTEWLLSVWQHHPPPSLTPSPAGPYFLVQCRPVSSLCSHTFSLLTHIRSCLTLKDPAQILPPSQMLFGSRRILLRARLVWASSYTASCGCLCLPESGSISSSPIKSESLQGLDHPVYLSLLHWSASCNLLPLVMFSEHLMLKLPLLKFLLSLAFYNLWAPGFSWMRFLQQQEGCYYFVLKVSTSGRHV